MGLPALLFLLLPLQSSQPATAADWKTIGMENAAAKKLQASLVAFEKACDLDPRDEDSCYYFARTLFTLDRWEKAREPFNKALQAASRSKLARVHRAIALNFLGLGNTAEAERHFRQAVIHNPGSDLLREDPRIDYGSVLFRQGRLEEALPMLKEAARATPGSARAHTELGRVVLHLGKPDAAAVSLEKAVNLDPRSSTARLLLGRTYLQLGRVEDGKRQLQLAREAGAAAGSSTVR